MDMGRLMMAHLVRMISSGERISAVRADAVRATASDANGFVESAMSTTPASGSDRTAEKKDVAHDSNVEDAIV